MKRGRGNKLEIPKEIADKILQGGMSLTNACKKFNCSLTTLRNVFARNGWPAPRTLKGLRNRNELRILSERNVKMFRLWQKDSKSTLQRIGKQFGGLTRERVRQICDDVSKALNENRSVHTKSESIPDDILAELKAKRMSRTQVAEALGITLKTLDSRVKKNAAVLGIPSPDAKANRDRNAKIYREFMKGKTHKELGLKYNMTPNLIAQKIISHRKRFGLTSRLGRPSKNGSSRHSDG